MRASFRLAIAPVIELIERRVLLSAVLGSDHTLTVNGTSGADQIEVTVNASDQSGTIRVSVNSVVNQFNSTLVQRIQVNGLDGNDTIKLDGDCETTVPIPSTLSGGAGNDRIQDSLAFPNGDNGGPSGVGGDSLDGGTGTDNLLVLSPASRPMTLNGGDGNDTLLDNAENGYAKEYGGTGNDTFQWFEDSHITCYGGGGSDTFDTTPASLTGTLTVNLLPGGGGGPGTSDGDFHFPAGDINNAHIPAGGGWNAIKVTGNNSGGTIFVDGGNDATSISIVGGSGNDLITGKNATTAFVDGGAGNDHIHASGAGSVTLNGSAGDDKLTIDGSVTTAWLNGGTGNDLLTSNATATHYSGGAGTADAVDYSKRTDNLFVYLDGSKKSGDSANRTDTFDGTVERVYSGSGNDLIFATKTGGDALFGNGGNDTLVAQGGSDALFGGDGNDLLLARDKASTYIDGGNGTDTAIDDSTDSVTNVESINSSTPYSKKLADGSTYSV